MALNVTYTNPIGYYTHTDKYGEITRKYKITICHANCLCAMMYFFTRTDENGKKEKMVQLHSFFADLAHAKRCIKDDFLENDTDFHFHSKEMSKEHWKLVQMLAKNGKRVTID